jgi:GR25 family glycosyltransferase involved in LPS biosynthesis
MCYEEHRMKIGVSAQFQFSLFSSGQGSTSLAIAETLRALGYDTYLVNTNNTVQWWDDCKALYAIWKDKILQLDTVLKDSTWDSSKKLDIFLEVGHTCLSSIFERNKIAEHCVYVSRKSAILKDIEASLFPFDNFIRSFEGLHEIWILDLTHTQDDIEYLEHLTKLPVKFVPFVWTPSLIESHRAETQAPEWLQIYQLTNGKDKPWKIHIAETNNSVQSSCTIPLLILRELKRTSPFPVKQFILHNADHIKKSEFFRKNVEEHAAVPDLSGEYVGRQRIIDWVFDTRSCMLSHGRFHQIRPMYLDAVWTGIPMVHNSLWISKELPGTGYDKTFYPDNEITTAVKVFNELNSFLEKQEYMFSLEGRNLARKYILEKISPFCPPVQNGWKSAADSLANSKSSSIPSLPQNTTTPSTSSVSTPPTSIEKTVKVLFTDMWDDFNPEYNMFILMMNEAGKYLNPPVKTLGISESQLAPNEHPNLVLFGPFGDSWRKFPPSIPKVHFTGENSQIIKTPDVVLNIGFQHSDFVDQDYLRLPLWMIEIDWFGADKEKISNPKPLPIDTCCSISIDELSLKKKFCAFVVTNPCNPVRNNAFHWLSQYKQVDSAGRLFNNVGDEIFAGRGGGGGELKKFEFLKHYKFCLAYENSSSQGYTTEKYLHAKAAGCIPIYWGDPKFERDFDINGCIDARRFTTPEELIEAVRAIDTNPSEWLKKFSVPALDAIRRDLVRRHLSECAKRLLKHSLQSESGLDAIPRFLGAKSDEEAKLLAQQREEKNKSTNNETTIILSSTTVTTSAPALASPISPIKILSSPKTKSSLDNIVVCTAATRRFLPSLHHWLVAFGSQKNHVKNLKALIWLGDDVEPEQIELLQKEFSWMQFEKLPTNLSVPDFPDLWEPQHFAWKLWILHHVNRLEELKNFTVLYLDSGAFMCRWPSDWLHIANEEEICLINDSTQTNGQWCHQDFCDILHVAPEEKLQHQIWAGAIAFRAGSSKATKLFEDSWTLAKQRKVIVGPKWSGVGPDKKPFGHRHDQSILSILSARMNIPRYPLQNLYCDHSLRVTFLKKLAFYVHRGAFTVNKSFAPGIDDVYVINLDRRNDRMEKLYKNHPEFENRILRLSAYEGKNLQLTPAIARIFRNHDFKWKKPVMGCALSHLSLWWQLANENDSVESYLILEDDVKFQPGWEQRWCEASAHMPEGWDVIYLGGILPPNRAGFDKLHERVNQYFSRVAPNSFYGQPVPNRYFHFCNYSYILSRQGARKILELIKQHDGIWTSADHCVCNQVNVLNHYFLDPLVAGCYQDDDPKYQTASFNDFSRKDEFDSDLWNNNEHFHEDDANALSHMNIPLDIVAALRDGRQTIEDTTSEKQTVETLGTESSDSAKNNLKKEIEIHPPQTPTSTPVPTESCWKNFLIYAEQKNHLAARNSLFDILPHWQESWWNSNTYTQFFPFIQECLAIKQLSGLPPKEKIEEIFKQWRFNLESNGAPLEFKDFIINLMMSLESYLRSIPLSKPSTIFQKRRILALDEINLKSEQIYERLWLEELLGPSEPLYIESVSLNSPVPTDCPIVIFMRPWIEKITILLDHWKQHGAKFFLLHLSDEYTTDSIDVYKWNECLGVVRIYNRADCNEFGEKVVTIPLGYHWSIAGGMEDSYEKTPRLPFRENAWSFLGTNWHGRKDSMKNLQLIQPHRVEWYNEWNDSKMVGQREYLSILLNSVFVPCPAGNNPETFRFYEALECGCIPLYVRSENDSTLLDMYKQFLPLADLPNWDYAAAFMYQLSQNQQSLEQYRFTILKGWTKWKSELKSRVQKLLQI